MPYRVLVPRGRPLEAFLSLDAWATAREALRLLASDPRPVWACEVSKGWRFHLPPDGAEWMLYTVDDDEELVTVIGAGRAI